MSWYYDNYKPTIETDEGIRTKSKRGDFVKNWWASRWIAAMENFLDKGRLNRGRSYARKGQVLSLQEVNGKIIGRVQGSRRAPYKYSIELRPLSESQWKKVLEALNEQPVFVAQLLAGEMPKDIEEAFSAVKINLFPARNDLSHNCSCPDPALICKHLTAVHYILAERFDEDPFLLFRLRGKTKEDILNTLGAAGLSADSDEAQMTKYPPPPPLVEAIDTFWQIGPELDELQIQIRPPETEYPILERLGKPAFLPEAQRFQAMAYDAVSSEAVSIAFSEETESKPED
jgi:uncharacterized Zn finger protein